MVKLALFSFVRIYKARPLRKKEICKGLDLREEMSIGRIYTFFPRMLQVFEALLVQLIQVRTGTMK